MAFSKLKAHLRRIGARTLDALGAPSVKSAASSIQTNAGTTSRRPATCQIKRMTLLSWLRG